MPDNQNIPASTPTQTVVVNQQSSPSNGLGVAGFILALLALVLCWVPVLDWVLWIVGLILSFIGVFKVPRGLAIAGLVISLIGLIAIIIIVGALAAAAAAIASQPH